jgi:hypothetical protein
MNKVWLKGLKEEQENLLKESATMGRFALERLVEVLKEYEDDSVEDMTRDKWFSGNWQEKQASLVGEVKTYRKIQEIVNSLLTKR